MKVNFYQKNLITKPNTKRKRLIIVIEITLVLLVSLGTIFGLVNIQRVSFGEAVSNVKGYLSIQKMEPQKEKDLPLEEKIKLAFGESLTEIVSIEISEENFSKISAKSGLIVFVSSEKPLEQQAQTLQNILSKAKIEERSVSLVDFRFDKLVVRYSK